MEKAPKDLLNELLSLSNANLKLAEENLRLKIALAKWEKLKKELDKKGPNEISSEGAKQTAVEQFADSVLSYKSPTNLNGTDYIMIPVNKLEYLKEQAKKMEKEQIKDAFVNGFCNANDIEDKSLNADTIFYNTRYGGNR